MPVITRLWAGMRTWAREDAETDERIVLIIHDNGRDDLLHYTFPDSQQSDQERGRSNLYEVKPMPATPIDIFQGQGSLQPSSIRVGIRGGLVDILGCDAWHPEDFFVFGEDNGRPVPLALARTITKVLSTEQKDDPDDPFGARISIPIPPVIVGHFTADIVGLIVLMTTGGDGAESPVELRIRKASPPGQPNTGEGLVDFDMPPAVSSSDPDSAQGEQFHQKRNEASFYYVGADAFFKPFKKTDLDPAAQSDSITLRLQTEDEDESWQPASFFIFGIGREPEVPVTLVPLVHIPDWIQSGMGTLKGGDDPKHLSVAQDPPP